MRRWFAGTIQKQMTELIEEIGGAIRDLHTGCFFSDASQQAIAGSDQAMPVEEEVNGCRLKL